jgi:Na+-transporting NADH:ubiquinone oxidoreductase subunit NqrC
MDPGSSVRSDGSNDMKRNYILIAVFSLLTSIFFSTAQVSSQPASNQQTISLIDKNGEAAVYIGLFLIIIVVTVIIGALSKRVEQAILIALGLSLILIAIFLFIA